MGYQEIARNSRYFVKYRKGFNASGNVWVKSHWVVFSVSEGVEVWGMYGKMLNKDKELILKKFGLTIETN